MRIGRCCAVAAVALAGLVGSGGARAQGCDVDDYITKAIGIEEPWVENAGYLYTQMSHSGSPRTVTVAPELEARFSDRVGMELDLPSYTAGLPLGREQGAFGPLAAGIKVMGVQQCDMSDGHATLLTGEIEGQYWGNPRPDVLPDEGDSVTAQAMWAQLWYPWFTQGEVGFTQRVSGGVTSGWFVNASLGRALGGALSAQVEVALDNQLVLDSGGRGLEGSVMPQIAYRPSSGWLLALGEQASFAQGSSGPQWSTWLMVEREFSP